MEADVEAVVVDPEPVICTALPQIRNKAKAHVGRWARDYLERIHVAGVHVHRTRCAWHWRVYIAMPLAQNIEEAFYCGEGTSLRVATESILRQHAFALLARGN